MSYSMHFCAGLYCGGQFIHTQTAGLVSLIAFVLVQINTAMRNYLSVDGWYLLRPSLSNPGQYSICVS